MLRESLEVSALKIWNYAVVNHTKDSLCPANAIFAFGCGEVIVAEHAARLGLEGFSDILVCSGKRGESTAHWRKTEAETFKDIAVESGFGGLVLIEPESTNTRDNLLFSLKKFEKELSYRPANLLIVCLAPVQRRVLSIAQKHTPDMPIMLSSADTFTNHSPKSLYPILMGEVWRNTIYPLFGFQVRHNVSRDVYGAYLRLYTGGFRRR